MNDDWYRFMQSKPVRVALNTMCAVITGSYAVGAVMDLVSPGDQAQMLMESLGTTGFYAITVARMLVCLWVAIVFARMTLKVFQDKD